MSGEHPLRDKLHDATHHVPGVPPHVQHQAGHHGRAHVQHQAGRHGRALANRSLNHPHNHSLNHSPDRPPRVLVGLQRRIALFFGRQI